MSGDDPKRTTSSRRALAPRPDTGLLAWQATLGYMSTHHSPDAMLRVRAVPAPEQGIRWSATVTWGLKTESIDDAASLAAALDSLWRSVEQNHTVFIEPEDATRSPTDYSSQEWLDVDTREILHRLLWTTQTVFAGDWSLVMIYQPSEVAATRTQLRLLAKKSSVSVGGRGASLLEATRELFRNAAPIFARHAGTIDD